MGALPPTTILLVSNAYLATLRTCLAICSLLDTLVSGRISPPHGLHDHADMLAEAGGPDRWRVINIAAGGRHSLVLALPDNGDLMLQHDAAARSVVLLRGSGTSVPISHHCKPGTSSSPMS